MKAGFRPKRLAALLTVLVLLSGLTVLAFAQNEEISSQPQHTAVSQKTPTFEERLSLLESKKADINAYLDELSAQIEDLTDTIRQINEQYERKQNELASTRIELAELTKNAEEQYDNMKIRIQYLYETGISENTLTAMLSAESFLEFLARAENYADIAEFDRQMLNSYGETILAVQEHEEALVREKEEIFSIRSGLQEQLLILQQLYEAAYQDVQEGIVTLDAGQDEQAVIQASFAEREEAINEVLREQYAREAAEAESMAAEEWADLSVNDTADDDYWAYEEQVSSEEAVPAEEYAGVTVPEEPVIEEAVYEEPVNEEPVNEEPVSEEPVNEEPVNEEPVSEEPVNEEPASEPEQIQEEPAYEEPAASEEPQEVTEEPQPEEQDQDPAPEEEYSEEDPSVSEGAEEQPEESSGDLTYLGNFMMTAYCPCAQCCGAYATGYTASGTLATEGVTVAMGGVEFGTRLMINGHIYTVEDRGTAYGHVDIFFASHEAALAFGLQYADVYIVG